MSSDFVAGRLLMRGGPAPCRNRLRVVGVEAELSEDVPRGRTDVQPAEVLERVPLCGIEAGGQAVTARGGESFAVADSRRLLRAPELGSKALRGRDAAGERVRDRHLRRSFEPDAVLVFVEVEAGEAVVRVEVI